MSLLTEPFTPQYLEALEQFRRTIAQYHVERSVIELNKLFDDTAHIIYVNVEYRGNDDM